MWNLFFIILVTANIYIYSKPKYKNHIKITFPLKGIEIYETSRVRGNMHEKFKTDKIELRDS